MSYLSRRFWSGTVLALPLLGLMALYPPALLSQESEPEVEVGEEDPALPSEAEPPPDAPPPDEPAREEEQQHAVQHAVEHREDDAFHVKSSRPRYLAPGQPPGRASIGHGRFISHVVGSSVASAVIQPSVANATP